MRSTKMYGKVNV